MEGNAIRLGRPQLAVGSVNTIACENHPEPACPELDSRVQTVLSGVLT